MEWNRRCIASERAKERTNKRTVPFLPSKKAVDTVLPLYGSNKHGMQQTNRPFPGAKREDDDKQRRRKATGTYSNYTHTSVTRLYSVFLLPEKRSKTRVRVIFIEYGMVRVV
eukprot:jgi/Psemu1/304478/fgenesh1_kg.154_\